MDVQEILPLHLRVTRKLTCKEILCQVHTQQGDRRSWDEGLP